MAGSWPILGLTCLYVFGDAMSCLVLTHRGVQGKFVLDIHQSQLFYYDGEN